MILYHCFARCYHWGNGLKGILFILFLETACKPIVISRKFNRNTKKKKKSQLSIENNLETHVRQKLQNSTPESRDTVILAWKKLKAYLIKRYSQTVETNHPENIQLWELLLPGILSKIILLQNVAEATKKATSMTRKQLGQWELDLQGPPF